MHIEQAAVVEGSETPIGEGRTGALRCVLILGDGSRRGGLLKRAPLGQVAAEAFTALLFRAWGLRVPDPYLVAEGGGVAFASADLAYPNLKQRLQIDAFPPGPVRNVLERMGCQLACGLASTPLAIAADEAIDNRDRNLGNILWDGQEEAWIDHAFALGQGPAMADVNKLCVMAVMAGEDVRLAQGAVARALTIDPATGAAVEAALPADLASNAMAAFVAARVAALAGRVLARFPRPPDLLSPLNGN